MHDLFTRGVDAHGHLRPPKPKPPTSTNNPKWAGFRRSGRLAISPRLLHHQDWSGVSVCRIVDEAGIRLLRPGNLQVDAICRLG